MAKENFFVKLGEKASSFACPSTGFTIRPNEVLELSEKEQKSIKVKNALKGNHLEKVTEEDYNNYIAGLEGNGISSFFNF